MEVAVLVLVFCSIVFGLNYDHLGSAEQPSRRKREAVGALDIVTNHAQPIHAEVKAENDVENCSHTQGNYVPSKIEPGVVFQVTPPKPVLYEAKSLRKSLTFTTKLDLIRGINRLITLLVLAVSAIFEFYPVIKQACETISDILYNP